MWEHIAGVENAGVENAGATKYGKPPEENTLRYQTKYQLTLKYQTKYGCRGFHAHLLPNATRKRVGLLTLLLRREQVGTSILGESHSDANDDDDTEAPDDNTQHQNDDDTSDDAGTPTTVSSDAAVDFCEVCLVAPRDTRIARRWWRAVINASVSRVPTKCTTKDAAVLFAARLSTCCCVCTNVTYA